MANEATQFVSGYVCPGCNFEVIGLRLGERRWTFTMPDKPELRIECSNCTRDVPRDHWRFTAREM